MAETSTDVTTAQTFDVGAFLNNIANTGVSLAAQRLAPTQNTGAASVTTTPGGVSSGAQLAQSMGVSTQTLTYIGLAAALAITLIVLTRK